MTCDQAGQGEMSENQPDKHAGKALGRTWTVSATEAQNNFGRTLGQARQEGHVFVTRYDTPEAVVMSIEEYDALTGRVPVALATLEREFDEMVERMQQPAHRAAVDALFAGRSASTSR